MASDLDGLRRTFALATGLNDDVKFGDMPWVSNYRYGKEQSAYIKADWDPDQISEWWTPLDTGEFISPEVCYLLDAALSLTNLLMFRFCPCS